MPKRGGKGLPDIFLDSKQISAARKMINKHTSYRRAFMEAATDLNLELKIDTAKFKLAKLMKDKLTLSSSAMLFIKFSAPVRYSFARLLK